MAPPRIESALRKGILQPGEASKLAGALSWGSSHMFRHMGRAMLRPLFDQVTRRDGALNPELRQALRWWVMVLRRGVTEVRPWILENDPICHLFCDASGKDGHMGAVLLVDGQCMWTHAPLADKFMRHFLCRRDNQILGLELAAIGLGLSTFAEKIAGRSIVVHCDNSGAEARFSLLSHRYVFVLFCLEQGLHAKGHCSPFRSRPISTCTVDARSEASCAALDTACGNRRQCC